MFWISAQVCAFFLKKSWIYLLKQSMTMYLSVLKSRCTIRPDERVYFMKRRQLNGSWNPMYPKTYPFRSWPTVWLKRFSRS